MKKLGYLLAVMVLVCGGVSGCTGMADAASKMAGLGVVSKRVSTFEGATIVEVTPQFLYDPRRAWGNSYKLGARWTSAAPDHVALVMEFGSGTYASDVYVNFSGLDVNVDGEVLSFDADSPTSHDSSGWNSVSRTVYTKSSNSVVVPLQVLELMILAEDCRLRIHSSDGYEDAIFSRERIPGGQGTAILSMREFMEVVGKERAVVLSASAGG